MNSPHAQYTGKGHQRGGAQPQSVPLHKCAVGHSFARHQALEPDAPHQPSQQAVAWSDGATRYMMTSAPVPTAWEGARLFHGAIWEIHKAMDKVNKKNDCAASKTFFAGDLNVDVESHDERSAFLKEWLAPWGLAAPDLPEGDFTFEGKSGRQRTIDYVHHREHGHGARHGVQVGRVASPEHAGRAERR